MLFQFPPLIEAGIAAGQYLPVFSSAGVPLGLARDAVTGKFVGHAIGVLGNGGIPLNPLTVPVQLATSGAQMYQMHQGFQSVHAGLQTLQASVGVLQATTAVIGVGVVAGVALSAVNLHQTLKLRKAVERLELKVENGFLDLQKAFKEQGTEIKEIIQAVAQDIKFEQHRVILIKAYGLFIKALDRLRSAIRLQDANRRNAEIDAARGMLFEALADYTNPHLLEETSASGLLRRQECAWAIEQTIISTYQMQGELLAVSDRLSYLQDKIRMDGVKVIELCQTDEEIEFVFPEISRIRHHDLVLLESWQNQNDWVRSLPSEDIKLLQEADFSEIEEVANNQLEITLNPSEVPAELLTYQELQAKSHSLSLRDQLLYMMDESSRKEAEKYISQEASLAGHKTFNLENLQKASDFTVANLYWYFRKTVS